MDLAQQRLEFAPPPTPGIVRAMGLAIIAHMLLVAALTWGVRWKRDAVIVTAEAELWSAVPQAAAPKLVEAPPPPPPEPVVKAAPPPVVAPKLPDADIALERDKQRLIQEKQEAKEKADKIEKAREAQQAKEDKAQKALDDKKKAQEKLAADKQAADAEAKKSEIQRQENIKRMAGLAGATGSATATGAAPQSSGPSPGYAGRIRARIKPNIVFTADIAGNPTATVEVRVSPDGTITSRKLLKSSGNAAWDEAVLKAVDKTEVLPRDTDGQVPPSMEISFRPKD
jgi:colicin import membrane protein